MDDTGLYKSKGCRFSVWNERHRAQLFLFWPPDGEEAPGESWELAFFGVIGDDPHTDSLSEGL